MHNKFVIEEWADRRHFYFGEKNLQKSGLKRELKSV